MTVEELQAILIGFHPDAKVKVVVVEGADPEAPLEDGDVLDIVYGSTQVDVGWGVVVRVES